MIGPYYLSGPMRGYDEFNFPLFTEAARRLHEIGVEVFSPAEYDLENGFDPTGMKGTDEELAALGFNMAETLRRDLDYIINIARGIVVLPKWHYSSGSKIEVAVAQEVGLPIFSYVDRTPELIHRINPRVWLNVGEVKMWRG